jgi:uncharacterized protein YifE (UPF0438 family)
MSDGDHDVYLRKQGFQPACSLRFLDRAERRDLKQYGHWLQALADGTLSPESDAQEQFVALVHSEERPDASAGKGAYFADLWWRYQRRIEWEEEQAGG